MSSIDEKSAVEGAPPGAPPDAGAPRASGRRQRRREGGEGAAVTGLKSGWLSLPAILFVAAIFLVPMGTMILYSFWPTTEAGQLVHRFTFSNYSRFFTEGPYWHTLLRSIELVGIASLLTVVFTLPLAYFVATKVKPSNRVKWILVTVMPFWTSWLIRVFSWVNIFGTNGAAAKLLSTAGVTSHTPGFLEAGKPAIVVTFIYLLFPFAFLCSYVAIERLDPALREAGADLGARPWRVFSGVTIPLVGAGLLAGFALSFIAMMGDYVTPQLVGGTEGSLYSNLVVNQFGASTQWGFGAALAIVMMAFLLAVFGVLRWVTSVQSDSSFSRTFTPSKAPFLRLYSFLFIGFLYTPIVLVVLFAFNSAPYVGFPIQGLTTRWFSEVLNNTEMIEAFGTSVKIALTAVAIALVIGVPAAIQISRTHGPFRNLRLVLLSLPLLIPPVIVGLGLLLATQAVGIERGYWTIVAGHALFVLPLVVLIVLARLEGLDSTQELAAMDLGARPLRALVNVVLPQIGPAIAAAAMLGIALSLDEFIFTALVTRDTTTLPLFIYSALKFQIEPSLNAVATLVLTLSFGLALLGLWINSGLGRRRKSADVAVGELLPT
jgi:ABC-type spermidine/putrescine transport system permease subunit II